MNFQHDVAASSNILLEIQERFAISCPFQVHPFDVGLSGKPCLVIDYVELNSGSVSGGPWNSVCSNLLANHYSSDGRMHTCQQ